VTASEPGRATGYWARPGGPRGIHATSRGRDTYEVGVVPGLDPMAWPPPGTPSMGRSAPPDSSPASGTDGWFRARTSTPNTL
jgi:hypothetical protein